MSIEHPVDYAAPLAPFVVGGAIINNLMGVLPAIVTVVAASVATFYYALQIVKDPSVKAWLHNRKAKKILKLEAEVARLKATRKLPDEVV
jgi:hypothetical protein